MNPSVCTLAFGREEHLANMVRGLSQSSLKPHELVIAVMQDRPYHLLEADFPIRQLLMGDPQISLAKARNKAARASQGDFLVFLDVDCIPHPELLADYVAARQKADGLMMGEVAYLPSGAIEAGIDFDSFESRGVCHSERPGAPETDVAVCSDYRSFWSLNFAMCRKHFDTVGGFDERFTGYGGEDTDFGRMVATAGIPLYWIRGAKAFHQYHPHHMPPVHHLDSVLRNAERFADKWGEPTMQHWLKAFNLMGLARHDGESWCKIRDPDEADLALTAQQAHQPYASSATVLEMLEARPA